MLIKALREQSICSCGNWVDRELEGCPDYCEEKCTDTYDDYFESGATGLAQDCLLDASV